MLPSLSGDPMNTKIIEAYAVWTVKDEYGRRGQMAGVYRSKQTADSKAAGKGYYGSQGDVALVHLIELDGAHYMLTSINPLDLDDLQKAADDELRAQLLKRLSAEELRVLGVKLT